MSQQQPLTGLTKFFDAFGRFLTASAAAAVEHGPEILTGFAHLQVADEYAELLQKEWSHHPLLDFILWQEASAGLIMAVTLPERTVAGHRALAGLLRPSCTAREVLDELQDLTRSPDLAGWSADEFLHGLEHVRADELHRAVGPLTLGLEGLLRRSAVAEGALSDKDVDGLDSGSQLVKQLWDGGSRYRPYMKSWVFGMADVYRHGSDRGTSAEQALHAVCGAAIWADHLRDRPTALERIEEGLSREVVRQFSEGQLDLEASAVGRLERAADEADKSRALQQLLQARDQLLELRRRKGSAKEAPS